MAIELKFKLEGSQEFERGLEKLRTRALPFIAKDVLNQAAVATEIHWKAEISNSFMHRDKSAWIERSLRFDRARGSNIDSMQAEVGALADRAPLLGIQETGGTVHGNSGKHPIPAPAAAMQAAGSRRTKRVVASRMLRAISVSKPGGSHQRKQANAIAAAMAKRKGQKFAVLVRPSGGKGLFLIGGGKRKMTARLVWDMSKGSVHIPAHNVLQRALSATERIMPHITDMAVESQLRRQSIGK